MAYRILLFCLIVASALSVQGQPYKPENYRLVYGYFVDQSDSLAVIRDFSHEQKHYFLALNPWKLDVKVVLDSAINFVPLSKDELINKFKNTPYEKALRNAELRSTMIQNAGITHLPKIGKGVDLTIDLCPSKLPLDKDFFVKLIDVLKAEEQPVPLAISITGAWLIKHPADFEWLVNQEKIGNIKITWINHSYHHRVSKEHPLKENFLLAKGTNIRDEVLFTEKALLKKGEIPSLFFRFPGLVSNKEVFDSILSYGLIPIGSDAWLAKNQKPLSGSIVLVHANGNEPIGLKKFQKLLSQERDSIIAKRWLLYDLRESVAQDEQP